MADRRRGVGVSEPEALRGQAIRVGCLGQAAIAAVDVLLRTVGEDQEDVGLQYIHSAVIVQRQPLQVVVQVVPDPPREAVRHQVHHPDLPRHQSRTHGLQQRHQCGQLSMPVPVRQYPIDQLPDQERRDQPHNRHPVIAMMPTAIRPQNRRRYWIKRLRTGVERWESCGIIADRSMQWS